MNNVMTFLNKFGKQVMNRSKAGLQRAKPYSKGGGPLEASIDYEVKKTPTGVDVLFSMKYYGQFIDKGVSGVKVKRGFTNYQGKKISSPGSGFTTKGPPIDVLSKWIKKKGIKGHGVKKGRSKKTGQFISGLAYLISKKIKREGIPSLMFFQKPLGIAMKTFGSELKVAISRDIDNVVKQLKFD